ncbi:reverse transcriptase-like protein [bacterium]|nr:reverse transcriptase-like protein [bacterium]NBX83630.1 reverse transcriptase-like protein [bacterium]
MRMVLFCDGASRGNPGPGAYGFVLMAQEEIVFSQGARMGVVTNNVAEYEGLLKGLEKSIELGADEIEVRSDSQLLVRQLLGEYKVKAPHIIPLVLKAKKLLAHFKKVDIQHIRREQNTLADALCNQALDESP